MSGKPAGPYSRYVCPRPLPLNDNRMRVTMFLIHEYAAAALAVALLALFLLVLYVIGYLLRVVIRITPTIQHGLRGAMSFQRSSQIRKQASVRLSALAFPMAECAA